MKDPTELIKELDKLLKTSDRDLLGLVPAEVRTKYWDNAIRDADALDGAHDDGQLTTLRDDVRNMIRYHVLKSIMEDESLLKHLPAKIKVIYYTFMARYEEAEAKGVLHSSDDLQQLRHDLAGEIGALALAAEAREGEQKQ